MLSTRGFAVFTTLVISMLVVLAATATSPAQADTITQTIQVRTSNGMASLEGNSTAINIFITPFDPAVGTLTNVIIRAQGSYIPGIGFVGATGPANPTLELDSYLTLFIFPTMPRLLGTQIVPLTQYGSQGGYGGPDQEANFDETFNVAGTGLDPADFEGPGAGFSYLLYSVGIGGFDTGISQAFDSTQSFATLTITYNYDPVPEPASLALMLAGLVCLWGVRRFDLWS